MLELYLIVLIGITLIFALIKNAHINMMLTLGFISGLLVGMLSLGSLYTSVISSILLFWLAAEIKNQFFT